VEKQSSIYNAEFPSGTKVRIKNWQFLEEFQRNWKFHHPLQDFQLDCAGEAAVVSGVGYYHGGDVLYHLEKIRGIWHEACLENFG
jgi:hypothetical protein